MLNPVALHSGRMSSPRQLIVTGALILVMVGTAAALLQHYWIRYPIYEGAPRVYAGWFYLFILAELLVIVPWAALRGAALWKRLERDRVLEEYRRSRLTPASIAAGALWGSMRPVAVMLAMSFAAGALLAAGDRFGHDAVSGLTLRQLLMSHALLLAAAGSAAATGMVAAEFTGWPLLAVPACLAGTALSSGALLALNPFLPRLQNPDAAVWWLMLPNPAVALGTSLEMDILRSGWIYDHVQAQDYLSLGFSYPSPLLTALLAAVCGGIMLGLLVRRVGQVPR